jgi:uracil-DNA glycosylase
MPRRPASNLAALAREIRACRICRDRPHNPGRPLPHEPRPVFQVSATARIALCGQAPGTRVHASGRPFTDPSGDRLRAWLAMSQDVFYDRRRIAIVPMGFCFPGLDANGGDLPPRRECAVTWHRRLFDALPQLELLVLIGHAAQRWHLGDACPPTLTETVRDWRRFADRAAGPCCFPLPHPSWRNNAWLRKHSWFEVDLLPALRMRVTETLRSNER